MVPVGAVLFCRRRQSDQGSRVGVEARRVVPTDRTQVDAGRLPIQRDEGILLYGGGRAGAVSGAQQGARASHGRTAGLGETVHVLQAAQRRVVSVDQADV